ncbi:MAG: hypothetical protein CMK36_08015 [Porticoccaceae bacterium]|nr:hypothetical protein [Porticoccaceae bacterium]
MLVLSGSTTALAATSVSQYGITWTFNEDYQIGQFVSGDYWVVENVSGDGVTITNMSPGTKTISGRDINGSMINPMAGSAPSQGFDSSLGNYEPSLNIGVSLPKIVPAGSSIVSVISHDDSKNRPRLTDAAILTVLSRVPAEGDFRPPYIGSDKTLRWSVRDIDYSWLRSLPKPATSPPLSAVAALVERPYIEIHTSVGGREWHPLNNQQFYGREIVYDLSECLLSLQLDYSNEQKEHLLFSMLQLGIDIYGAAINGGYWEDKGGHNHGRKMTMVLAGVMFNDPNILEYADAQHHMIFQEDLQTFYVTQADIDDCPKFSGDGRLRECYTSEMLGMPEWGAQHASQPSRDGSNWDVLYRTTVGNSQFGHVLAARLMNVEGYWNHPALFEYMDRLWEVEKNEAKDSKNKIHWFEHDMWKAYRYMNPPEDPSQLSISPN